MATSHFVLIVDDDPMWLDVNSRLVQSIGYSVRRAGDVSTAMRQIQVERIDIVLLDLKMLHPLATDEYGGLELLRHLRDTRPELPVVVVTGYGARDLAHRALGLGAVDILDKALPPREFGEVIRRAITAGARLTSALEAPRSTSQAALPSAVRPSRLRSHVGDDSHKPAAIVCSDLVGYSLFRGSSQAQLVAGLNSAIRRALNCSPRGRLPNNIRALPTGDGCILVFFGCDNEDMCDLALTATIGMQKWAHEASSAQNSPVALRLGLGYGPVQQVLDINNLPNVCGATINATARVMSLAKAGQVLASKEFVDHFIGLGKRQFSATGHRYDVWAGSLHSAEVKHGVPVVVACLGLAGDEDISWWSNPPPASR